ncbi:acetate--CoA ligase family protein [Thalassococcus sp. S3]|uniref:acetate--CoA ligase family protein n=1 Tax=Thalassococcus sp. S3 TaxID=2017482 RepID=UPI001023FCE3|nr:acetate--CoA ligase family protein [Thalassococcus sp. S3]QBF29758.1 acyl-CoA synthetase [Thalassococcus sp. S3]
MQRDLSRLLRPRHLAVVGGGAWCRSVIAQAERFGFEGALWPVHPKADAIAGHPAFPSVEALPEGPDAAFIGVNRQATPDIAQGLARRGGGGAVCFASGFSEAQAEDAEGAGLQARLVAAAGAMPVLGPNCYGFINALDGALIWPDQHGCKRVERGVAILAQSSNIAINLTMQRRALPIGYVVTCGNMAQTSQAEIARALLDDPRVTALGLHVEGFGDLRQWEDLARAARGRNVPVVVLKVGTSEEARVATVSHTASLAGSDAGAQALLDRLGFARVADLPAFLETLKLLHVTGPLAARGIASISCSGGEASLAADMAQEVGLPFPPVSDAQKQVLRDTLGPMVALANPLDYHTYIWRDTERMARAWGAMTGPEIGLTMSIVDYPHTDPTDWACATEAAIRARQETGAPFAVVASLPELMPEGTAEALMAKGVAPLCGLREALAAASAAGKPTTDEREPLLLPHRLEPGAVLSEVEAKNRLASADVDVPISQVAKSPEEAVTAAAKIGGPVALKGLGLAHKSEAGAVRLGLGPHEIAEAARKMPVPDTLVEEMIEGGVAELLVGVTCDPAHGFVLTLGAGGVLTELLQDSVSLLIPATRQDIANALDRLRCSLLLNGYRGRPAADRAAVLDAVEALQHWVIAHADEICEVEINPLICTPERAVAADALIRLTQEETKR